MPSDRVSRRRVLQGTATLAFAGALPTRRAIAKDTVVGFIYVGSRDDYGYNQAHAQGAAALKKLTGIKVVEEEKVPETDAVEKTMESMINLDGATLLFPTSFGYYNPHMIKMANKYPKLRFEHCGGLWSDKDPKNAGSYFGYIDEAQYISGIVAGHTSKSGRLGFVAAKPIPQPPPPPEQEGEAGASTSPVPRHALSRDLSLLYRLALDMGSAASYEELCRIVLDALKFVLGQENRGAATPASCTTRPSTPTGRCTATASPRCFWARSTAWSTSGCCARRSARSCTGR